MKNFLSKAKRTLSKLDNQQIIELYSNVLSEQSNIDSLFQSLPELFIIYDIEGKVLFYSNHLLDRYGFVKRIKGKYIWDVLINTQLSDKIQKALKNNEDVDEVLLVKHDSKSDEVYHTRFRTLPFVQEKKITGTILIVSDYTAEKQYIEDIVRLGRISSMSDISSGIAHEIRNPLAAIGLHLHLIQKEIDRISKQNPTIETEKLTRYTKIIEEECQSMDDVVSFFLYNTKKESFEVDMIDINSLIRSVLELIVPECEQKNIHVYTQLSDGKAFVLIAPSAIRHVLLNLIKNAMDAMTQEDINEKTSKDITIGSRVKDNIVQVCVADTGRGIDKSIKDKIFNAYFTTKDDGTGIGLAIVEKIMELHKGKIYLETQYKKGACFVLEFPAYAKYFLQKESF